MRSCSVVGCEKKYYAKSFCVNHYALNWRNGTPERKVLIHGFTESSEWRSWAGMRKRCKSKTSPYYKKGITVCDRWANRKNGFLNFIEDMGLKPTPYHSIDRISNSGNYEPGNCRWATDAEQSKNRDPFKHNNQWTKNRII